jgi:protein phosphatase
MNLSREGSPLHLEVAGGTHIGGRRANDDHYGYDEVAGVLAVADGVSGRPAARIAAETAIEALLSHLTDPRVTLLLDPRERLEHAFAHVQRRVREQAAADEHLRGMATTLACAMEHGDLLAVGHAGDSRVLRFREGRIQRLTTDHRLASDALVRARLPPEAVKLHGPDTLTRGIGLREDVTPEVCVEALLSGDGVLVATDGLTDVVDDDRIAATLGRHQHPQAAVEALIQCALASGAPDNIACVYGRWHTLRL